jgi:hypothetical protein
MFFPKVTRYRNVQRYICQVMLTVTRKDEQLFWLSDTLIEAWRAQSVQRMATGSTSERPPLGSEIFFYSTSSRVALWPIQPPIQWVPWALSPGIKLPGREADHSLPSVAEAKKTWIYTSTPAYAFMA